MTRYLVRRLLSLVFVLWGMSVVIFLAMRLLPGDVINMLMGMETAPTAETRAILEHQYGLDRPLVVQYWLWIGRVVQGDLGVSMRSQQPVVHDLLRKLPVTVELTFLSVSLATIIAVPLGVVSAVRPNSVTDFVSRIVGVFGLSIPNFWLATLLIMFCSRILGWLPPPIFVTFTENPIVNLQQMLMPTISLSLLMVANTMRMTRGTVIEEMTRDYVRVARSKGLSETVVIGRHVLKNVAIPVVTRVGMSIGYLLGGAIIIEQIFALPGLGWFLWNGVSQRDYTSAQAAVMVGCLFFAIVNLVVDLLYALLDPRIRRA